HPSGQPNQAWIQLDVNTGAPSPAIARIPGDPFGYAFASASDTPATPLRVVVVAETSKDVSLQDRGRQRLALDRLLESLPESTRVTLMRADWDTEDLADNASPSEARSALDKLDAIPSAGALDLESALMRAVEHAETMTAKAVIFVGHGYEAFRG